jgi:hypothetical protein
MSEAENDTIELPKAKDVLTEVSANAGQDVSNKKEQQYREQFRSDAVDQQIKYTHWVGIRDHYEHKGRWSYFLMISIAGMLIFQKPNREVSAVHVSDCDIYTSGVCDCGGLDLASYESHMFVPAFIPSTGRFGFFVDHMGRDCFIEPHQLPTATLAAVASSCGLENPHNGISVLSDTDCVDFDSAKESIIAQLKAFTLAQRAASCF